MSNPDMALPADITAAIEDLLAWQRRLSRVAGYPGAWRDGYDEARAALDAAILKHLAASAELEAEVTCLTIRAERAEAHSKELIWQDSEMCRMLEAENARLREALALISQGHDEPRIIASAALTHERCRRVRAALTLPATAE